MRGRVVELWRYPVKSMRGERCEGFDVGSEHVVGDRSYALVDQTTGNVASAKNPRKWPGLLDFAAEWLAPPAPDADPPPVAITFPDGRQVRSDDARVDAMLTQTFGRAVALSAAPPSRPILEEYWPDIDGLTHRELVTDEAMPPQTFFDCAGVHIITTQTLSRLSALRPASGVTAARFRPNFVVTLADEPAGFLEGAWVDAEIAIGPEVVLRVTAPCGRCVMTTLEQPGLSADPGILRTLAAENGAQAGVYAEVVRGGAVREGDVLAVVPARVA